MPLDNINAHYTEMAVDQVVRSSSNEKRTEGQALVFMNRIGSHLANERTMLAWGRTGCSFMGVGMALIKFDDVTEGASGVMFLFVGFLCFVLGYQRYKALKNALDSDEIMRYNFKASGALGRYSMNYLFVPSGALVMFVAVWFVYHVSHRPS